MYNYQTQTLDPTKKDINIGDFGPPAFTGDGKAKFKGPSGIDNVNIEIIGARHNDFVYRVIDENGQSLWNDNPFPAEQKVREINRKTNIFMQRLYEAALAAQTEPERLNLFFDDLKTKGAAKLENGIWQIDPEKVQG